MAERFIQGLMKAGRNLIVGDGKLFPPDLQAEINRQTQMMNNLGDEIEGLKAQLKNVDASTDAGARQYLTIINQLDAKRRELRALQE